MMVVFLQLSRKNYLANQQPTNIQFFMQFSNNKLFFQYYLYNHKQNAYFKELTKWKIYSNLVNMQLFPHVYYQKLDIQKLENPLLKLQKVFQISQFCYVYKYVFTYNLTYFCTFSIFIQNQMTTYFANNQSKQFDSINFLQYDMSFETDFWIVLGCSISDRIDKISILFVHYKIFVDTKFVFVRIAKLILYNYYYCN
eukprot:TRINITY_DN1809_c0_g1_i12.p1 TRINITY_DN1809_c0_g1~~TRINITY_DN1809_c0_g1_i12.p1  ORF type:complete len:197 (+),score=-6.93 TRINITY_DN1809_c0_g1_i12:1948-2538(+)